jgi:hypothetical protein
MIRSLRRFEPNSPVWVLCLDKLCFDLMTQVNEPNVHLVSREEFEQGDAALEAARKNRSLVEYYFTCTPSLVGYVLQRAAIGDSVTYLDADLFFFSNPAPLHEELGGGAVSIVSHRFTEALKDRERYGKYNVGWLTFRNDARGRAVQEWWRDRCNEWCFDRLEGDRFADQKYLERFSELFPGTVELNHEGANVAPWNIGKYDVTNRNAAVFVGEHRLVFFHFHGLKEIGQLAYRVPHHAYRAPFGYEMRKSIYRPYVRELANISRELRAHGLQGSTILSRDGTAAMRSDMRKRLRRTADFLIALLRREVLFVIAGRAI